MDVCYTFLGGMAEWTIAAVLKTAGLTARGFESLSLRNGNDAKRNNACGIIVICIAVFVVDSCAGICSRRGMGRAEHVQVSRVVLGQR